MCPSVELRGVTKAFPGRPLPVVDNLSLSVEEGQLMALVGPSGCGKTTTLRLIAGLEWPNGGQVLLIGQVVSDERRLLPPERRRVGMVFQEYALFPHLTVKENVAFGLRGLARPRRGERIGEVLELTGLGGLERRYPAHISGGEQQRVALARALAPDPVVVLLDEPFSNLDAELRVRVRREVRKILKEAGTTAIFVTHDQEEALFMGDKVAVMNTGRVEQMDTPYEVFQHPRTRFVAQFLGTSDFLPARPVEGGLMTELGLVPQVADSSRGEVEVMVRPDDLTLGQAEGGNGVVTSRQFLGTHYMYTVALASGTRVRVFSSHMNHLEEGTNIAVRLEPRHELVCFVGGRAVESRGIASSPQLA
ncbi:MAG: ABC transporter ATP-binding protein [Chloroflexi bacterium]|nr:ABC transporter ATP-binding protein [Chloroflexota bacterium]